MLKRVGGKRHPYLTTTNTLNHSVSLPSVVTAHLEFLKSFSRILMIFLLIPILDSIFQRALVHIVSNADLKSMKLKCTFTLCFLAFSAICRTVNIASTVPLLGRNTYWFQ